MLLTRNQTAEQLGITPYMVSSAVKRGELHDVSTGDKSRRNHHMYFDPKEVAEFKARTKAALKNGNGNGHHAPLFVAPPPAPAPPPTSPMGALARIEHQIAALAEWGPHNPPVSPEWFVIVDRKLAALQATLDQLVKLWK